MAGILIGKSYKEWQDNPVSTSITTHPIDDLDFPKVTICPPKNSNTALYHDLVKAGNGTLSDEDKQTLKESAFKIFMLASHKEHVEKMIATTHMGNMDQVLQGFHSVATPYKNGFEIKMWNLNGTITSPWYKGDFQYDYYLEDRDLHIVLEFPSDIKDQVGSGSLNIDLEVDMREEEGWKEQFKYSGILPQGYSVSDLGYAYKVHKEKKNRKQAEDECAKEGGHLAYVASAEANEEFRRVAYLADVELVWLGGRSDQGVLSW